MSFWLYFRTSIIASTAAFVEAAKGTGGTSLLRESGIRGPVACKEKKNAKFQQIPIVMPLSSRMHIIQYQVNTSHLNIQDTSRSLLPSNFLTLKLTT